MPDETPIAMIREILPNGESEIDADAGSLSLPGPPLSLEQFREAIRRGDQSGVVNGNPVKRILQQLREMSQNEAA